MTTRGWLARPQAREWTCAGPTSEATTFHRSLPGYAPTRLVELGPLAAQLGVGRVFVKDESERLGLPAFKALGASWAVARVVARRPAVARLVTATDGNHGRAVARSARLHGLEAVVYVPAVMRPESRAAIQAEGAVVLTVDGSYDDAVAQAAEAALADPDAELVQDTAWDGYRTVPQWIVDGYSTLFVEADAQLRAAGVERLTLVAVPVGVGSLAQAAVVHHRSGAWQPPASVLGVEPDTAACVLASLAAGEPTSVETAATVMAGLNCGTPSSLAWPVLRGGMDAVVAVTDAEAERAVRDLGTLGVASGPSGAASLAGARAALTGDGSDERRADLGVGADSVVLLLSTEAADGS